jgi:MSHA biogenesis protein MshG
MSAVEYRYTAADSTGRTRRGVVLAATAKEAYRSVAGLGLTPTKITKSKAAVRAARISRSDVAAFTRELAVLTRAKVPLDSGLASMIPNERNRSMRAMIRTIASSLASGQKLSEAVEPSRKVFGDVYVESLKAAEHSGNLAGVCERLAEMLDRRIESDQTLRRAMIYPVFVMGMVAVALCVILIFVVPRFSATFAASGIELPLITRIIQGLGVWLRDHVVIVGSSAVVIGSVLWWWLRTNAGRLTIERLLVALPYTKDLVASVTAGRFTGVLQLSMGSGLGLIESMRLASRSTGQRLFMNECDEMLSRLEHGETLASAISGSRYLPPFAERLIGAGKDSSELVESCGVIAAHFDRKSAHLVKNMQAMLEPLMTVMLAGVVLLVALSVLLPMWEMVSAGR